MPAPRRRPAADSANPTWDGSVFMVGGLFAVVVLLLFVALARSPLTDPAGCSSGEGQITLSLPDPANPQPVEFAVRVEPTADGRIGRMTLAEEGNAAPPLDLGADVKRYQGELAARHNALAGKPGTLELEIGDGLLHGHVVQLLDIAIRTGFKDTVFVPADPNRR